LGFDEWFANFNLSPKQKASITHFEKSNSRLRRDVHEKTLKSLISNHNILYLSRKRYGEKVTMKVDRKIIKELVVLQIER